MLKLTSSSDLTRTINRSNILDLIRENGPVSRAQISKETDISLSTVMRIVDELKSEELVYEVGKGESTGGRPGTLYDFNHQGFAVIAVDLGGTKIYGTINDLSGTIIYEKRMRTKGDLDTEEDVLERLMDLVDILYKVPRPEGQKIMGIGIGAPGITMTEQGIITNSPSLGWKDLPLRDILYQRFNLPIFIENDVNLAALGEYGFGAGRGSKNMVCLALGTGIGAGIIIGGLLYKGQTYAAGEIGYMIPSANYLGKSYTVGLGALEQVASGTGLARRARQILLEKNQELPECEIDAKYVFTAARNGEAWAKKLVDETVDCLTLAIANINSLLNPEVIVLTGGLMKSADLLLDPIRERLRGLSPALPKLVISSLGPRAIVMGATLFVLSAATDSRAVKQLP